MKKRIILLSVIFFSVMLIMSNANAVNTDKSVIHAKNATPKMVSEKAIVDGVSKFLLERAEANLIYAFEKKIKNSEKFECYFPSTREQLKYSQLQEWLLFPREMWKVSIEKDIELFAVRSTVGSLEKNLNLSDKASALANVFLKLTNDLVVEYEGKNYSLAVVDRNHPSFERVNGFSNDIGDIVTALNVFRQYTSPCESPMHGLQEFKNIN